MSTEKRAGAAAAARRGACARAAREEHAFFGDEGIKHIRKSSAIIVGCGGVGSCAGAINMRPIMLARLYVTRRLPSNSNCHVFSGVKRLRLVDFY